MSNTTKLSDRVRPGVEAAPWVIEEIKKLEERIAEAGLLVAQSTSYVDSIKMGNVAEVTYETMQKSSFNRPTGWKRKYNLKDAKSDANSAAILIRQAWEILDPMKG